MLSPYEMSSVIITGSKSVQQEVIEELHRLKVIHIIEHSKSELADIGAPFESAIKLSEILVKIRALISSLGIKKEENKFEFKAGLLEIGQSTVKISSELNKHLEELKNIEVQLSRYYLARQELETLKEIDVPLEYFAPYRSLSYFTGYAKNEQSLSNIKSGLSAATKNFMLLESIAKKKPFIVLFVDSKAKDNADMILKSNGFSGINFANISNLKGSAAQNLKKIEEDIKRLQKSKEETNRKIELTAQQNKDFLLAAESFLAEQLEKAEAPLKFASTRSSFLVKGWIPTNNLHSSIEKLNKAGKGNIYIQFEPPKKKDKVPVKLKNPKIAKPFEFFMDMYSMPSYREIDPTFFVFLTFPIFFGMMLGDIGYGLVSLAVFWLLKRKMPKARNLLNVLMVASFVTIFFGFFFGEFFGLEIYHPVVSREHDMFTLMFIAVGIGVIHVNIGLIIGFVNELKSHGLIHAVYAKASWIILEIGLALLALSVLEKILITPWIGAAFLGASILMLLKGEGFRGIIEIPSIFANIVSYVRLAAIGLTSVILALIINESAAEFFHKGGFFILAGVLILVVGHVMNILIGWLGSFLHSLRLHYVEFFSKFYTGGAKKYHPFGIKDY
ncbi:V-type ATP synthase subunit I [Candidatus Woesearchaeota archaeon]|nr:V-type ATP synthase subunit I [Candidatus Woesearchaeota archaeon]